MDPEKLIGIQHQMRENNQELQDFLKDLDSWEKDIKVKDKNLKTNDKDKKEVIFYFPERSNVNSKNIF